MEAGMECPFRRPPGLRLNVTGMLPYPQARPMSSKRSTAPPPRLPPGPVVLSRPSGPEMLGRFRKDVAETAFFAAILFSPIVDV